MKPLPEGPQKRTKASQSFSMIRLYLLAYNLLSAVGWTYVFCTTMAHLSSTTPLFYVVTPASSTATSALMRLWDSILYVKSTAPITAQVRAWVPEALIPFINRATTTFVAVGVPTALVQSLAALEVVHSLLGWVRSPVTTTIMQVSSRLILVWGITEKYESARSNPIYSSMVISWSITEIIRYFFYAGSLADYQPKWLLWLRYNAFFVLYPLGAGSEAALIFSTLPSSIPPRTGSWTRKAWNEWDYFRGLLFLVWWPGLYIMYTHMIRQRRKIFRKTIGGEPKRKM